MKIRFWLRLIFLFALTALILTACKSDSTPQPTSTERVSLIEETDTPPTDIPLPTATEAPTEVPTPQSGYSDIDPSGQSITFWHPFSGTAGEVFEEIVADFNAGNEWGITVSAEYQGSFADLEARMLTFMNTADAPDLIAVQQSQAATYQLGEALVNLDDLLYDPVWGFTPEEINDFYWVFLEQGVFPSFENARLGLPIHGTMNVMLYNANWLSELGYDAPPETPESFVEMACAATVQPYSGATAVGRRGYQLHIDEDRFVSWASAFGGKIFNFGTEQYQFDNAAIVEAMTFLQNLINRGCAVIADEPDGDQIAFGRGEALFAIDSNTHIPNFRQSIESEANFNWRVVPIPHATVNPAMNVTGVQVSIPKTSEKAQLAGWLFLKYLTEPNVQARWGTAINALPVRQSAAGYFISSPAYQMSLELLQYGISEPPVPGYDVVRGLTQTALFDIIAGADVASTLSQLTTDANILLEEQLALIPESPDPWADVDPSGQTIYFWHNHTDAAEAALNEIANDFNVTNKWGITVVPEYKGGYSDIFLEILPLLGTDEAPSLVTAYAFHAAAYYQVNGLADLNTLVDSTVWGLPAQDADDFFDGIYTQDIFSVFDLARLGFPVQRSTDLLYYNADWLAELGYDHPPQNPTEFQEMACAAAGAPFSGSTGETSLGIQIQPSATRFLSWIYAFGGDIFDEEVARYTLEDPEVNAAVTLLRELIENECAVLVEDRAEIQAGFGDGEALFMVESSFQIPEITASLAESDLFEWSAAPMPHVGEDPIQQVFGASLSIPTQIPEKALAAWLFIQHFTTPEAQAQWAQSTGYLPVRAGAAEGLADHFDANPAYQTAFNLLPFGIPEPSVPGYDFVRNEIAVAIAAILEGLETDVVLGSLNGTANQILSVHMGR